MSDLVENPEDWFSDVTAHITFLPISNIHDEPTNDKYKYLVFAPIKDSDQPGHLSSPIRVTLCLKWVAISSGSSTYVDSED